MKHESSVSWTISLLRLWKGKIIHVGTYQYWIQKKLVTSASVDMHFVRIALNTIQNIDVDTHYLIVMLWTGPYRNIKSS